jgi:hypothetical protein
MVPTHWLLNAEFDVDWNATLQAVTAFADVTGRNRAGLELTWDIEKSQVSGRLAYSYTGLGPRISLGVSRQYTPRDEGYVYEGVPEDWTQVITRAGLGISYPIYGVDTNHGLTFSYNVVHSRPLQDIKLTYDPQGDLPTVPESYFRAGISFGWAFSDTVSSPLGIGAHKGRSMSASLSLDHPSVGGTQTLATFRYRWTEFVGMPWLEFHTLRIALSGGVHISDPPNQWSFSVGGYNEQNIVDTILNNSSAGSASLRGYPSGAFKGSHYHSLRLSYQFPLWFAELGYGTVPVFLKRIAGLVFNDNALISYDELDRDDWKTSVGAEVVISFALGYYQYMNMRLGYARGFMEKGGNELIFIISGSL